MYLTYIAVLIHAPLTRIRNVANRAFSKVIAKGELKRGLQARGAELHGPWGRENGIA